MWPEGAPRRCRVGGEGVLGLGHADGQAAVAGGLEGGEARGGAGIEGDVGRAVDAGRDRADLVGERHVVRVEEAQASAPPSSHSAATRCASASAPAAPSAQWRQVIASTASRLAAELGEARVLGRRVRRRNGSRRRRPAARSRAGSPRAGRGWRSRAPGAAKSSRARSARGTPPCIFSARIVATTTAADGASPAWRHLMSRNFSAPRSAPKPASVTTMSASPQAGAGGDDRVAAVGDVGEGAAVDQRRAALDRLDEVRQERVLEEDAHGAGRLEIGGGDGRRSAVSATTMRPSRASRSGRSRARQSTAMTSEATVMSKPSSRAIAVGGAAEARHDLPQGAVVHVEHALPGDAAGVDARAVAPVDVVVEERRRGGCGRW